MIHFRCAYHSGLEEEEEEEEDEEEEEEEEEEEDSVYINTQGS